MKQSLKEKIRLWIFNIFKKQILEITLPLSRTYQSVQIIESKYKPQLLRYQYMIPERFNNHCDILIDEKKLNNAKQHFLTDIEKYINVEEDKSYQGHSKMVTLSLQILKEDK